MAQLTETATAEPSELADPPHLSGPVAADGAAKNCPGCAAASRDAVGVARL
jgi:hypothetical protein